MRVAQLELDSLVRALRHLGDPRQHSEETSRLLESVRFSSLPPLPWRRGRYTRNLVYRNDAFELLLLCWSAGARTPIHDHDGQECWLKPLSGSFEMEDYDSRIHLVDRREGVRSLDYQPGGAQIHRVTASERALSLHLYAAPVDRCRIYAEDGRAFWRQNRYDSSLQTVRQS